MRRVISLLLLWTWAWSSSGSQTEEDALCSEGVGYTHNGICCLNCPAGTFVKEACTKVFERSVCHQCEFDTYTEHDNGISSCLKCTKCRPDQELVEPCNSTRNTHCQCKAGSFCLPDQACEVCKTCRKCKEDEEIVKSCTAQSNTVCQKRSSYSTSTVAVISVVAVVMIIVIGGCVLYWRTSARCKKPVASRWPRGMWKMCIESDSDLVEGKQIGNNGTLEDGAQSQPFITLCQMVGEDKVEDDEDKGLGPSLSTTTASSQASLTVCPLTSEHCLGHLTLQQLNTLENTKLRRLVPVNGDDSLRKSFDLFGEIDVNFHNRFFRLIGLNDNAIRTAEMSWSLPEDRVYELLKIWMEKEGMKADFNRLIKDLLSLNQRLSAENITAKAIEYGYFRYEDD
ncbi:hematopoietic death receptor isoform X1 [Tachysurus fulvidraco]|uniref:hematopoietic death receptor isoform X1 n=1 Tax=Tachysurus fulvidraco TaxID=1234273 RepID=UPI000F50F41F|nr:hematopoietic death receptor isoform X1 [Tachysurus fulvidraco]